MKSPGANVSVSTEVGYCPFCQRSRTLRKEVRHLGALVRTTVDCETCHRSLSSTIGPPPAEPEEAKPVPETAPAEAPAKAEPVAAKAAPAKPAKARAAASTPAAKGKTAVAKAGAAKRPAGDPHPSPPPRGGKSGAPTKKK